MKPKIENGRIGKGEKDWRGKLGKSWEGKLKMQTKKYELKGEARQGLGIADDSSGLSKVGMSFGKQALDR